MVSDHLGLVWQGWGMAWTALLGPNHGFDIFPTSKSRVSSGKLVRNIQKNGLGGQNIDFFEIFQNLTPETYFFWPKNVSITLAGTFRWGKNTSLQNFNKNKVKKRYVLSVRKRAGRKFKISKFDPQNVIFQVRKCSHCDCGKISVGLTTLLKIFAIPPVRLPSQAGISPLTPKMHENVKNRFSSKLHVKIYFKWGTLKQKPIKNKLGFTIL